MRKKIDLSQTAIIAALRDVGAKVQTLAAVGCGCPDLAVIFRGQTHWIECKTPGSPSRRALTTQEDIWHQEAARHGVTVIVAMSGVEALRAIGAIQ